LPNPPFSVSSPSRPDSVLSPSSPVRTFASALPATLRLALVRRMAFSILASAARSMAFSLLSVSMPWPAASTMVSVLSMNA
jgi:hypothetical protein